MKNRWALPLLITKMGKGKAVRPKRIDLGTPPFKEGELQDVLAQHSELLPAELLDPIFCPPICIGREVRTGAGPIDLL